MVQLSRARYAQLYGPSTGDRVRLADTDLVIEAADDLSGGPGPAGEEALFGGGTVIRESMGQRRATRAEGAEDPVIPGVVVLDHWGIGKAEIVIGPGTEVLAGNGKILTAGGIDCHVRAGRPLLHTTVGLGPGETAWLPSVAPVAYASTVHIGADADVLTGEDAVRLPLPGGWVTTAWGAELHRVARAAERLYPGIGVAA